MLPLDKVLHNKRNKLHDSHILFIEILHTLIGELNQTHIKVKTKSPPPKY